MDAALGAGAPRPRPNVSAEGLVGALKMGKSLVISISGVALLQGGQKRETELSAASFTQVVVEGGTESRAARSDGLRILCHVCPLAELAWATAGGNDDVGRLPLSFQATEKSWDFWHPPLGNCGAHDGTGLEISPAQSCAGRLRRYSGKCSQPAPWQYLRTLGACVLSTGEMGGIEAFMIGRDAHASRASTLLKSSSAWLIRPRLGKSTEILKIRAAVETGGAEVSARGRQKPVMRTSFRS